MRAFGREVLFQALAQHGCMHPDDVVRGGVVVGRAAEHLVTNFLLVDLRGVILQDAGRQVHKQVAQPRRPVDVPAGSHTPDQRFSSVDGD